MFDRVAHEEPVVHVIDDDDSIRDSIANLLLSIGRCAMTYQSAVEFLEVADRSVPGCILTDVRLPGMSGLELQRRLLSAGNNMPIILMTGFADIPMTVRGMKNGALDFLLKPLNEQNILEALDNALELDKRRRAQAEEDSVLRDQYEALTSRERQVLALVAAGKRNREVAEMLSLSEITIKIHRSTTMRKLNARNLQDIVRKHESIQRLGIDATFPSQTQLA
ncbi:response regulator [Qipengyuania sp. GH25]|uniref:Response regulator n=1 Tax=Qipengyuania pacifica TaxID=2860199 RepID=A0ABS7JKB2_9SPHN|nr:response regulator [Qipengyuania aerophila]MBX7489828.1 response regulator [Qipengyuania aerophila]